MAKTVMTPVKAEYNAITKVTYEAATTPSHGLEYKLSGNDESTFVLVTNTGTGAGSISVKAPTKGGYAAATSDLSLSLAAGETAVIRVESARYANNDGTILLAPSVADVKAAAIY